MRKLYIVGLIVLATILIGLAFADQMTFSTYYPAPYGVYRQMQTTVTKLMPSDGPPDFISGNEEEGMLYFDDGTTNPKGKGLYYYDSSAGTGGDWVPLGGGGGWVFDGTQIADSVVPLIGNWSNLNAAALANHGNGIGTGRFLLLLKCKADYGNSGLCLTPSDDTPT